MDTNEEGAAIGVRRARLVVRCATELMGIEAPRSSEPLQLQLSAAEFELLLQNRYGETHPELVFRTESSIERARLDRTRCPELPKVLLRQGAPPGRRWVESS